MKFVVRSSKSVSTNDENVSENKGFLIQENKKRTFDNVNLVDTLAEDGHCEECQLNVYL